MKVLSECIKRKYSNKNLFATILTYFEWVSLSKCLPLGSEHIFLVTQDLSTCCEHSASLLRLS